MPLDYTQYAGRDSRLRERARALRGDQQPDPACGHEVAAEAGETANRPGRSSSPVAGAGRGGASRDRTPDSTAAGAKGAWPEQEELFA